MLNWDHIRYFIAVADHGSVSRAARALKVSHATVLRAVGRLEESLQIRLFDHARTGYRLTDDGMAILRHARGMEAEAQQLLIKARSRDTVPTGELNVALPDQSLFDCMPLLRKFTKQHPNISINLKSVNVIRPDDFLEEAVDVLLLISNDAPEEMVGRQLCRIRFAVYGHRDYVHSSDDLQEWIGWSLPGGVATKAMDDLQVEIRRLMGSNLRQVLDAGDHDSALRAIQSGLGIGLVAENRLPELIQIPMSANIPDWGLWCLTHPDFRHAARVNAMMRFLAEALIAQSVP